MNSFKFILNLAMLLVIFLSMKVAATARVPSWKIEPHQEEAYGRLLYIVNDRPRSHNYIVVPPPPPPY
ncbi:hypothetical protein MtrunA17_Chr3g0082851 [Medicago truncatula]|uniref:Transmembrane protein n=1 Tax=Medicago truncatula TaxID=3880 RepID=A0A396IP90_MEDTR|nr:hypothetical protein MtrunA17_Chr3g0082851 [Medicago truncatula]